MTGQAGIHPREYDVVVVGAGFSGICAVNRFRDLGLSVRALEAADAVGGTWRWNRYPGARCDIESIEYSYSFSEDIQQEWVWTETLPCQPEIEAYLNFVVDRLDLRKLIQASTEVVSMVFDEDNDRWLLTTATGETFRAPYVVAATGILSAPLDPDIPGKERYGGVSLSTARYPDDGFDYAGKRVGVIGTGSTGVQAVPVIAVAAAHLWVFQRSAAYTLPSNARPFVPGELDALKADYAAIRAAQRAAHVGAARISAFSVMVEVYSRPALLTATPEERQAAVEERGVAGALYWSDVFTDMDANAIARELYCEAIARIVHDPATAAALVPTYPFGCKRPIIDLGYYEAFNRDNVSLVDLRASPIVEITESGIRTEAGEVDLDVIVFATGFDAVTGALSAIEVRGCGGLVLGDVWRDAGAESYLGLQVAGFPNLFLVQGPGSPSLASNFVTVLEDSIDWIATCLADLRAGGYSRIEALPAAQAEWTALTTSLVEGSVLLDPSCNSWWNGGNVPGKKRRYLSYVGGVPEYRKHCIAVAEDGYRGFALSTPG